MTLEDCLHQFNSALADLRLHFGALETALPAPKLSFTRPQGWVPRYAQPSLEHALLMKLARSISILGAMRFLVETGYVQEQGILQRTLDETDEDILFLALGKQNGLNRLHRHYLDAFWREEFEDTADPKSYTMRKMPRREDIRKYVSRHLGEGSDSVTRMVHGVFSAFVHGASTPLFDLVDSQSLKFRLAGVSDSADRLGYIHNAANYPYRVLMSAVFVAKAAGCAEAADALYQSVRQYGEWFDSQS